MTRTDVYVARCIINAQQHSDVGKGIMPTFLNNTEKRKAIHSGYMGKTEYILNALNILTKSKSRIFNFFVEEVDDQNGYPSVLTYFEFRIDGIGHGQVSFHTPLGSSGCEKIKKYCGKGRKTHWDHKLDGSRKSCGILEEAITM